MPKYLIAIQHPNNYDGRREGADMMRDIDALNEEMRAAGVRLFAGGLEPASKAWSLQRQADGSVAVVEGPYLEATVHVGGFWILQADSMDDALQWGRKAVLACRVPVEVRAFLEMPE